MHSESITSISIGLRIDPGRLCPWQALSNWDAKASSPFRPAASWPPLDELMMYQVNEVSQWSSKLSSSHVFFGSNYWFDMIWLWVNYSWSMMMVFALLCRVPVENKYIIPASIVVALVWLQDVPAKDIDDIWLSGMGDYWPVATNITSHLLSST